MCPHTIQSQWQTMDEEMEGINGARNLVTAAFFSSRAGVGSCPFSSLFLTNWNKHGCSFFMGSSTPVGNHSVCVSYYILST